MVDSNSSRSSPENFRPLAEGSVQPFENIIIRSLDSSIGAQEFVTGMQVYYNYIRPHQGIGGLTPAQMAKIPIDLMGNRWEKMIELAIN